MSTLNSRKDLLRELVLHGRPPTIDMIIEEGLDAELLSALVRELKPHMDYLRGYKALDSWFTQTVCIPPYRTWLEEAGLVDQHPYCINLLHAGMQDAAGNNWLLLDESEQGRYPREERRFARLMAWLTRKNEWIIWANHPTSDFRVTGSAEAALGTIQELTPKGISLCDPRGVMRSPALCMFADLQDFLSASIEQKRKSLQRDEDVLKMADTLCSRFH